MRNDVTVASMLLPAILWVLASGVGGSLGGAIFAIDSRVGVLTFGVLFAVPQWLVIRRYLARSTGWISATAVGTWLAWPLAMMLSFVDVALGISHPASYPRWLPTSTMGAGLIVGASQSLFLYERVRGSSWWMVASAFGGIPLGSMLAGLVIVGVVVGAPIVNFDDPLIAPRRGFLGGLGYGIITTLPFTWLLVARRRSTGSAILGTDEGAKQAGLLGTR